MSAYTNPTQDPNPAHGLRRAVLDALKRDRRNMLRRRQGA
jgi:hypothetical protein